MTAHAINVITYFAASLLRLLNIKCTAQPFFLYTLDQFLLENPEVVGEVFELADLSVPNRRFSPDTFSFLLSET